MSVWEVRLRHPLLLLLLLVLVSLALYANALDNPFLSDDQPIILHSPTVTRPSLAGLLKLWTTSYWQVINEDGSVVWLGYDDQTLYRPITILSLWLNAQCGGGVQPWVFRLANILLHAMAAWMIGLWCARWTGRPAAIAASAAVVLHPVATDVINRVVGRADILVLLGLSGFLATQRAAQQLGWTWRRTGAAAMWTAVALGAKESGVVLLPLAALQAWLGGAEVTHPALRSVRTAAPPIASVQSAGVAPHAGRAVLAVAIPLLAYALGRSLAVGAPTSARDIWDLTGNPVAGKSFMERIPVAASLACDYIGMLVWPHPLLSFILPSHLPIWSDWKTLVGVLLVGALVAAGGWLAVRKNALALAIAWWLFSFLIVGQLVLPIRTYMEVRLVYPMLGSLALALAHVVRWRWWRRRALQVSGFTVLALVASTAVLTIEKRNLESRSDVSLAEADVRHRPGSAGALIHLVGTYEGAGRSVEAERALVKATEIAPSSSEVWYQLGAFYAAHGHPERSKGLYERALAADPWQTVVMLALGTMALDANDVDTAERFLTRAQQVAPEDPYVAYNLAVVDDARGRSESAIKRLEDLVRRRPDFGKGVEGLAALKKAREQRAKVRGSP